MSIEMTVEQREAFLAEARVGVVSVASGDERPPLTVPIWYAHEPGGELTFFTGTQGRVARKTRLIKRAGVVSFNVQHGEYPYRYVTVEGTVVGIDRPPRPEAMLAIASRYLSPQAAEGFVAAELGNPGPGLVLVRIRPDRWTSADFSRTEG